MISPETKDSLVAEAEYWLIGELTDPQLQAFRNVIEENDKISVMVRWLEERDVPTISILDWLSNIYVEA